ncbi:MAG: XRE family transcriptional regulator [Xanthobacteraceae bacterium]
MPILNQRDYRVAKARFEQLGKARASQSMLAESAAGLSADVSDARRSALVAEQERLAKEIETYESLRSRDLPTLHSIESVDLGMLPIIGRITRGWSQKQLAELLGLKEQQIQRYEAERYAGVSLNRYERILEILSVELSAKVQRVSGTEPNDAQSELKLDPALIREILKRGWVITDTSKVEAAEAIHSYVRSGLKLSTSRVFHRQNLRHSSAVDEAALNCWRARALQLAYANAPRSKGRFNIADIAWLGELVQLSGQKEGPIAAIDLLHDKGIVVVIEPHLVNTRLDGAAFLLSTGVPVIALTLRYDRLDYFWFTLLHELGHILLHFNRGLDSGFVDDLEADGEDLEKEADTFAKSTLISDEIWKAAPVRFSKSTKMMIEFAESLGIHVAIVAGRIRQERRDYKKFGELVGQGELQKMFATNRP